MSSSINAGLRADVAKDILVRAGFDKTERHYSCINEGTAILAAVCGGLSIHLGYALGRSLTCLQCLQESGETFSNANNQDTLTEREFSPSLLLLPIALGILGTALPFAASKIYDNREQRKVDQINACHKAAMSIFLNYSDVYFHSPLSNRAVAIIFANTDETIWSQLVPKMNVHQCEHVIENSSSKIRTYVKEHQTCPNLKLRDKLAEINHLHELDDVEVEKWGNLKTALEGSGNSKLIQEASSECVTLFGDEINPQLKEFIISHMTVDNYAIISRLGDDFKAAASEFYDKHKGEIVKAHLLS